MRRRRVNSTGICGSKGEGTWLTADGTPYMILNTSFSAALLDLANPEACAWISRSWTQLIERGASGWMADFAEALPFDAGLHGETTADDFHNAYPVAQARVNREAIEEADEVTISPSLPGRLTGSPRYSAILVGRSAHELAP